jgi:hypothetical protein
VAGRLDLRVRVALHTGEAHERAGDFFGPALNRAARLRSLARGGTIVLSQATAELVRERPPAGIELLELGRQPLRGLSRPENVFELRAVSRAVPAGESAPVSPRTTVPRELDPRSTPPATARVPVPLTRTIGRDTECTAIAQLLARANTRLVTLAGPGGWGRRGWPLTSSPCQGAGGAMGGGSSRSPRFRPPSSETTLADALELVIAEGERPREILARCLAPRELLLVIDNFEHLLAAAPLLGAAPGVTVLSTSREPLGLRGEHVVRIAGLRDEHGAELFLERVRDHHSDFAPDDAEHHSSRSTNAKWGHFRPSRWGHCKPSRRGRWQRRTQALRAARSAT